MNKSFCGKMCQCSSYDSMDDGTTHNEKTLMADNTFVSPNCVYRTYGSFYNSLLSLTVVPKPLTHPSITEISLTSTMAPLLKEEEHDKLLKGLGSLYDFPRELRDRIYEHMIAQGSLAIMRTSSTIQKEVSKMDLYEHGFCRLNLNFWDAATEELKPCFNPSPFIVDKVRNVAIRVDTRFNSGEPYPTPEIDILNKFSGDKVHRKTCALSFVCWGETKRMFQQDVLGKVQGYTGFEKVEVAIDCVEQWPNEKWPERISKFSFEQMQEYSSKKLAMRAVSNELSPKMFLAEGGKWQKDRFTPMTFRSRGGLRALQVWEMVEMAT